MNEQLRDLIELQGLDTQFIRAQRTIKAGPAEEAKARAVYEVELKKCAVLESGKKVSQASADAENLEVQSCDEDLKRYDEKLKSVKNNKEYTIVKEAIEGCKERRNQHENTGVELLEKIDEIESELGAQKAVVDEKKAAWDAIKDEIEGEAGSLREKVGVLREKRKLVTAKLEPEVLAAYERILRSNRGVAVTTMKNEACQECFMQLSPVTISRVLSGDLVNCPSCERFLYDGEPESEN